MPTRLRGDAHVLEHRSIRQDVGDLIRAGDALLRNLIASQPGNIFAIEDDAAAAWPQHSGEAVEECTFAGAVGADDGANFVAPSLEADLRQRRKAAETDRQRLGLEHG